MKRTRGFTLIELMVVVTIVGILLAIAVPAFNEQIRKSRRSEALRCLGDIQAKQELWRANHATYGPGVASGTGGVVLPTCNYYTIAISGNTATAWTATATPIATGPQAGDRCGTYTFAVDNVARPGQAPRKTAAQTSNCSLD